ncbi:MAG: hypothetical protein JAY99_19525 [Candidatus Thiodiazotropha lotti]|uniref:hypothetical protein n=1 Tax=Candidatus Thiodiazotropha endoloripes TaxID=1818881 RepID=UPI00111274F0|nr:hypothetical protein [Candidatus Thiodiazotropha endoloripes]MCG7900567.1 hypothetical protein [Candidatus Thiodiazotropha weberae]MCG7991181.1 hypothetical protein [Candidatus Thiodiazotropha lotti]MCG7902995.1 hypothetical protein [Candidatus Thiodiazotropha weberae]MCG7915052.1 hypothetical protein [Candidatus Thiodiazotropha weberae]MCG8001709.1 hypothetical protein [Candidatus Thiodiazotropha lotti]
MLIATLLLVTTGLVSANTTEKLQPRATTGFDGFYGIEDYNDAFYGDVYKQKTAEQTPVVRFGK